MTVVTLTDSSRIEFLPDYCPHCNPLGDQADSPARLAALTEPTSVVWQGGRWLICEYRCDRCGHPWVRADLWTAEHAGLDPKQRRNAA